MQDTKFLKSQYRTSKSRKNSQRHVYGGRTSNLQSEIVGMSQVMSQADRLVSGLGQLKIKEKRAGRKSQIGGIGSQPIAAVATRFMPSRNAKKYEMGALGNLKLGQRVTGEIEPKVKKDRKKANAPEKDINGQNDEQMEVEYNPNDPYAQIRMDQNKNNEDIVCDVCLDDDDDENNEIVICDLCLAATHQTCYGSELNKGIP